MCLAFVLIFGVIVVPLELFEYLSFQNEKGLFSKVQDRLCVSSVWDEYVYILGIRENESIIPRAFYFSKHRLRHCICSCAPLEQKFVQAKERNNLAVGNPGGRPVPQEVCNLPS